MMEGVWYGRDVSLTRNNTESVKSFEDEVDDDDDLCENCRCTCDQERNEKTLRSFYVGKVKPVQNG